MSLTFAVAEHERGFRALARQSPAIILRSHELQVRLNAARELLLNPLKVIREPQGTLLARRLCAKAIQVSRRDPVVGALDCTPALSGM
jgi:hypothetical protein